MFTRNDCLTSHLVTAWFLPEARTATKSREAKASKPRQHAWFKKKTKKSNSNNNNNDNNNNNNNSDHNSSNSNSNNRKNYN